MIGKYERVWVTDEKGEGIKMHKLPVTERVTGTESTVYGNSQPHRDGCSWCQMGARFITVIAS